MKVYLSKVYSLKLIHYGVFWPVYQWKGWPQYLEKSSSYLNKTYSNDISDLFQPIDVIYDVIYTLV